MKRIRILFISFYYYLASSVDDTQTINITMNQPSAYQMISKAALG